MHLGHFPRPFNRPVQVYWAGFVSDTFTLEKEGWSFEAEQDVSRQAIRLAMHHRDCKITGITEVTHWEYERSWEYISPKPLRMVAVGNVHVLKGEIFRSPGDYVRVAQFHPVSCKPRVVDSVEVLNTVSTEPLAHLLHFLPVDPKRIILPTDAVPALMDRILELQEPGRQKHFQDMVRGKTPTLSAQLFTL